MNLPLCKNLKIASIQDQYPELEAPLPVGLMPVAGPVPVGRVHAAAEPLPEAQHALSVSGS